MVPVSSEGAPGRRRHHCGALCSCAGRSRRRVLQGRASNNTSRNEALFQLASIVTSFVVGLLLLRNEGVPCSFPKRRHLSRPPSLSRTTPSEKRFRRSVRPLPSIVFSLVLHIKSIASLEYRHQNKTKQNDTLRIPKEKRNSTAKR